MLEKLTCVWYSFGRSGIYTFHHLSQGLANVTWDSKYESHRSSNEYPSSETSRPFAGCKSQKNSLLSPSVVKVKLVKSTCDKSRFQQSLCPGNLRLCSIISWDGEGWLFYAKEGGFTLSLETSFFLDGQKLIQQCTRRLCWQESP